MTLNLRYTVHYVLLNSNDADEVTERMPLARSATNRNRVVIGTMATRSTAYYNFRVPPSGANLLQPHRLFRESIHQVPLQLPTSTALGHTPFAFALKHIISLPFPASRQRVTTELPKKEETSSGQTMSGETRYCKILMSFKCMYITD